MNHLDETISFTISLSGLRESINNLVSEAFREAGNAKNQPKEYISQTELGKRLRLSTPTLIGLRKKGIIQGVNIGNKWRYELSEVWEQLKAHQAKTEAQFKPIPRRR
jgi:hypothetical protein